MNNYIVIETLEDAVNFVENVDGKNDITLVLFNDEAFSKYYEKGYTKECNDILKYLTENFERVQNNIGNIEIEIENERLPKDVFENLYNFYKTIKNNEVFKLNKNNCKLSVLHETFIGENIFDANIIRWDFDTIIKANKAIDKVCSTIKNSNLSPMEAYSYIYNFVTNVARYNKSNRTERKDSFDQYFAGAFMDIPEIVCMGYSALIEEIISNLNMPGLECKMVSVEGKNQPKHAMCLIEVNDEKYKVSQTFFSDPTKDYRFGTHSSFVLDNSVKDNENSPFYEKELKLFSYDETRSIKTITNDDIETLLYDESENKIDQFMIETVYFNMYQKTNPNCNFYEIYESELDNSSTMSYQIQKDYGVLQSPALVLSEEKAKELYSMEHKNVDFKEQYNNYHYYDDDFIDNDIDEDIF